MHTLDQPSWYLQIISSNSYRILLMIPKLRKKDIVKINKLRYEKGDMTIDTTGMKGVIKNRYVAKWNKIETSEINLIHVQLSFDKQAKISLWQKNSLFNKRWKNWISVRRSMEQDPKSMLHKISSKWI